MALAARLMHAPSFAAFADPALTRRVVFILAGIAALAQSL